MLGFITKAASAVIEYFDPTDLEDYEKRLHALKRGDTFKSKMDRIARRKLGDHDRL